MELDIHDLTAEDGSVIIRHISSKSGSVVAEDPRKLFVGGVVDWRQLVVVLVHRSSGGAAGSVVVRSGGARRPEQPTARSAVRRRRCAALSVEGEDNTGEEERARRGLSFGRWPEKGDRERL